jgi:protein-disulfide isomerase
LVKVGLTRLLQKEKIADMPEVGEVTKSSRKAKIKGSILEKITPLLIVVSIILAFLVGVLWQKVNYLSKGGVASDKTTTTAGAQANQPTGGKLSEEQVKNVPEINDKDHLKGSKDAKVFLVEYSDFECPFCKRFHPTTLQVLEEYKNNVALVYRHFPLDQLHPKADKEAEASECVRELGGEEAFWKFVDKIFEVTPANNGLDHSLLPTYAGDAGVDKNKFESCLESGKYADYVEADYQGGIKAGVSGTPASFVINQKDEIWMLIGAQPYENLKAVIEEALKS